MQSQPEWAQLKMKTLPTLIDRKPNQSVLQIDDVDEELELELGEDDTPVIRLGWRPVLMWSWTNERKGRGRVQRQKLKFRHSFPNPSSDMWVNQMQTEGNIQVSNDEFSRFNPICQDSNAKVTHQGNHKWLYFKCVHRDAYRFTDTLPNDRCFHQLVRDPCLEMSCHQW